jgi:hypothetical protein
VTGHRITSLFCFFNRIVPNISYGVVTKENTVEEHHVLVDIAAGREKLESTNAVDISSRPARNPYLQERVDDKPIHKDCAKCNDRESNRDVDNRLVWFVAKRTHESRGDDNGADGRSDPVSVRVFFRLSVGGLQVGRICRSQYLCPARATNVPAQKAQPTYPAGMISHCAPPVKWVTPPSLS